MATKFEIFPSIVGQDINAEDVLVSGSLKAEESTLVLNNLADEDNVESNTNLVYFCFPSNQVQIGMAYKVNVYAIGESYEYFDRKRELVKHQTQSEVIKVML